MTLARILESAASCRARAAFLAGLVATSAWLFHRPASAELVATPLPGDARLVQFEYDADNTFLVLARPKAVTHIEFASDEQILTVAGGDTKHWELTPTANRRHLFVKPIYEQMETSMTVLTDKRSYQFVLRSTGPGAKWYQRVSWQYSSKMLMELRAEEERAAARAPATPAAAPAADANAGPQAGSVGRVPVEKLNFSYQVTGEAPFRPTAVFTDGKFTWIRLPAEVAEWPALFSLAEGDEAAVVNYLARGEYMVAQQVLDRGLLKLGRSEVRFQRSDIRRPGLFGNLMRGQEAP